MPNDTTINIRCTGATLALLRRAAEIEGKTLSAFIRHYAEVEARKVFPVIVGERCPACGQLVRG